MRSALFCLFALAACDRVFGIDDPPAADAPEPIDALDAPLPQADAPADATSGYVTAVLEDLPVAYLRLGEQSGVTAIDQIASGPQGTYLGMVTLGAPGALTGDGDSAATFDGMNAAVSLGNTFDFLGTAPFSLELWMKPNWTASNKNILSKWIEPTARSGWILYHLDDKLAFERDLSNAVTSLVEYHALSDTKYNHVVATYDGTNITLFVNGVQVAQKPSTLGLPKTNVNLLIGAANGDPSKGTYNGSIDEVAIYDHALSAQRVNAHFAANPMAH